MHKMKLFSQNRLACLLLLLSSVIDATAEPTAYTFDTAGGWSACSSYLNLGSLTQSGPCGTNASVAVNNHSGFLNAFVMHPNRDLDGDGICDENDPDDDGDGLSDAEELSGINFNPTTSTDPANADTDQDGLDDAQEARAGTNPVDFDSALRIMDVVGLGAQDVITWQGRDGAAYELLLATNVAGLNLSPSIMGPYTARGGIPPWFGTLVNATNTTGPKTRFYRIRSIHP